MFKKTDSSTLLLKKYAGLLSPSKSNSTHTENQTPPTEEVPATQPSAEEPKPSATEAHGDAIDEPKSLVSIEICDLPVEPSTAVVATPEDTTTHSESSPEMPTPVEDADTDTTSENQSQASENNATVGFQPTQDPSDSISFASSTSIEEPRPAAVAALIAIASESDLPTASAGSVAGHDPADVESSSTTTQSIDTVDDGLAMNSTANMAFISTELQDNTDKHAAESQEEVAEPSPDPNHPEPRVEPGLETQLYDNANTLFLSSSSSSSSLSPPPSPSPISNELRTIVDTAPQSEDDGNENLQQAPADAAIKQVDPTKDTDVEQVGRTKSNVESDVPAFSPFSPGPASSEPVLNTVLTPRGATTLDGTKNLVAISYAFKIDSCEWTFGYSKYSNTKFHIEWDLEDGFDRISGRSDSVLLVEGEDSLNFTSIIQFTANLVPRNLEHAKFKAKYLTFMLIAEDDGSVIGECDFDLRIVSSPPFDMIQRLRLLGEDRKPRATSPTLFITAAKVRWVNVNGMETKKSIRPEDAAITSPRSNRRLSRAITNDVSIMSSPPSTSPSAISSPPKSNPSIDKLPKLPSLPDLDAEVEESHKYSFKVNPAVEGVQRRELSRALSVATPERREIDLGEGALDRKSRRKPAFKK